MIKGVTAVIILAIPIVTGLQLGTAVLKYILNRILTLFFFKVLLSIAIVYGRPPISFPICLPVVTFQFCMFFILF